jgi:hypothetical protein
MQKLSPKQQALRRKHGTPDEFEDACKNCLGEISLAEMEAAVQKYRDEWAKAGYETHWFKIGVSFKLGTDLHSLGRLMVEEFETQFKVPAIYYARYVNQDSYKIEVSAFVADDPKAIKKWWRKHKAVVGVTIENRDPGSNAHACAYQVVKRLPERVGDFADDKEMMDVVHWMCNMRGYDYMREIRFYAYAAVVFSDMLAKQNDRALENLIARGKGKAPVSAQPGKVSPGSKPAKSSRAAARKVPARRPKKSAGSSPR